MIRGRARWVLISGIAMAALLAIQGGINVLWGVAILLIAATVAALVLPWLQLLGVRIRRLEFPRTAMVGEPQRLGYEIETPLLPRYGIEIHERLAAGSWSLATYIRRSRGRQQYFCSWTPTLRGHWQLGRLMLTSGYPLGVRHARRMLMSEVHDILVYPDFVPLRWLPVHGMTHGTLDCIQPAPRGGRGEVFALKPYRYGDEARHVHWRASARLGELVTREQEHQEGKQLWIVLELAAAMHLGVGPTGTCEQMIRIAYSALVRAYGEAIPTGLLYRVADVIQRVPPAVDRSTYEQLRDTLARVQAHAQVPLQFWLQRFREQLPRGGSWLIFNLAGEAQRQQLQAAVRGQSATPLLVEFDKASFVKPYPDASTRLQPVTLHTAAGTVSVVASNADLTGLFAP